MRLRKLIVLGALVAFTGGMMSCAKKTENTGMDSTATTNTTTTTAPATPPPAPAMPPADTSMGMHKDTTAAMGGSMKKEETKKTETKKTETKK